MAIIDGGSTVGCGGAITGLTPGSHLTSVSEPLLIGGVPVLKESGLKAVPASGMYIDELRISRVAGPAEFDPELNPENIIGDATWHYTPQRQTERINDIEILFVKHNVAVLIMANGHPSNQLQFVQDVARKIEAKITAVLDKK